MNDRKHPFQAQEWKGVGAEKSVSSVLDVFVFSRSGRHQGAELSK